MVKNLPANAEDARDMGLIPRLGRSPGEGNGNLFQYSCLENSMDRRAWWTTVHGVAELDMTEHTNISHQLKTWLLLFSIYLLICSVKQVSLPFQLSSPLVPLNITYPITDYMSTPIFSHAFSYLLDVIMLQKEKKRK